MLESLASWLRDLLGSWVSPPKVSVLVFLLALVVELVSVVVYRRIADLKKIARYQREIKRWHQEYLKALRKGDEKALEKLERRKSRIQRMQLELTKVSLKMWMIMLPPIIVLWELFKTIVGTGPVAFFPLLDRQLGFNGWYFIALVAVSLIFQRFMRPKG